MKQRMGLAIDEHVRRGVEEAARARGVSLSRYVTEILEAHLAERPPLRFPHTVEFTSEQPRPLAAEHDKIAFLDHRR